jgi:hypothetical protein
MANSKKDITLLSTKHEVHSMHCDTWVPEEGQQNKIRNVIELSDADFEKFTKENFVIRRTKHCDTWTPDQPTSKVLEAKVHPTKHCDTWKPDATDEMKRIIEVDDTDYKNIVSGNGFILRRMKHCDTWDPDQGTPMK